METMNLREKKMLSHGETPSRNILSMGKISSRRERRLEFQRRYASPQRVLYRFNQNGY